MDQIGEPGFSAPLLWMGAWGRRKALDLTMRFRPEETSAEGAAFLAFFKLTMAHFVFRSTPLPVFTDAMLRTLTVPVMAVIGGRDIVFRSAETQRRLAACVPQARVHTLPTAGHGLSDQTATVLEFLLHARPA